MALLSAYRGPGWQEITLALAASVLCAGTIRGMGEAEQPQTAAQYYFNESFAMPMHWAAVGADILLLGLVLYWIFRNRLEIWNLISLVVVSLASAGLAWTELFFAIRASAESTQYRLPELPVQPVANMGLVGACLFVGYAVTRMPTGELKPIARTLVRLGLACGLALVQAMVFEGLAQRAGT